ncbi:MAG: hypothetical protein QOD65_1804 [Gaiellales bacterium]|jgi:hypothetical protein|nr:hypothetical protein [Gaiellales bacterium]
MGGELSADQVAELQRRGWVRSTMEGMWEHPERVGGPIGLPEALELELGEGPGPEAEPEREPS